MAIIQPDRRRLAMTILRKRLELELRRPNFAKSAAAANTMAACRGWGFKGKTRKQALTWVESQILLVESQIAER